MAANDKSKKFSRWYFGGIGSAGAACCTHPLDLLKVNKNKDKEYFDWINYFETALHRYIYKHNKKENCPPAVWQ